MPKASAGILLYRKTGNETEVLLVHPGGPFWAKKDDGAWSIPKGETDEGENLVAAAEREFAEETGFATPAGTLFPLGSVTMKDGKTIHAWAVPGDCDPLKLASNMFSMEWPPHSGKRQSFPEIDRGAFFSTAVARRKINGAQIPFLERLDASLDAGETA